MNMGTTIITISSEQTLTYRSLKRLRYRFESKPPLSILVQNQTETTAVKMRGTKIFPWTVWNISIDP